MPLKIVRNDLTKMRVDAIVNTANPKPMYSSGTDLAVYKAAGEEKLLEARKKIGYMKEGEAAITPGFALPAKYIIHAVSPRYIPGIYGICGKEKKLRDCYRKSLELAVQHQCQSIAFPLIATGSYGWPKEDGMRIALDEIHTFLMEQDMMIYLVVFGQKATKLGRSLYPELEAYIDQHYVSEKKEEEYGISYSNRMVRQEFEDFDSSIGAGSAGFENSRFEDFDSSIGAGSAGFGKSGFEDFDESLVSGRFDSSAASGRIGSAFSEESEERLSRALKERMKHMSDTFQQYLLYLIRSKHLTNAEVYRNALVTKQLFSKIKLNPDYHPDKATAMRLCVGARLNLDETKDLLARAGYALSPCDKRDIIFSFFIEHGVFDMIEIDIALEEYGLPCFIQ